MPCLHITNRFLTISMSFTSSLLEGGPRLSSKGVDQYIREFTSPSTFCTDRSISADNFQDSVVSMINEQLPIPVVFRRETPIMAYLIQVEREDTACENRKYTKGKRKTKDCKVGSTLTFNFSFHNAVYPHPTSLSTDMLSDYLKSLGNSKNKTKVGKLLKFEVAVTGDTPTSRGFRDLNVYVENSKPDPFVPFDSVFTQEVCNFQKVPIGFINHPFVIRELQTCLLWTNLCIWVPRFATAAGLIKKRLKTKDRCRQH